MNEITKETRKEFEEKRVDIKLLTRLYLKYNSISEINFFIETALNQFPKLCCGLASVYLQYKLGGKVVKGKYGNHNHTFLLLEDKLIDITSDQYDGGLSVYVGPLKIPWSL